MSACLCTAEVQPVAAQDASVRIRAQERLHQRGEARLFRFFPRLHLQGIVYLRQQLAAFPAGQKSVVAHHLKMLRRYVADIASDHLFLGQGLLPLLSVADMPQLGQAAYTCGVSHSPGRL